MNQSTPFLEPSDPEVSTTLDPDEELPQSPSSLPPDDAPPEPDELDEPLM